MIDEGWTPADEDGLAILVGHLGPDAVGCLEMMSGAAWVRDQLAAAGWNIRIADARKAKAVGPLAAKTDRVDGSARRARETRSRAGGAVPTSPTVSSRSASADACIWSVYGPQR